MNIDITKGPSKHELFAAYSYGGGSRERIPVDFTLSNGVEITCILNTVTWESGSGQSWNIGGYICMNGGGQPFSGYYSTDSQTHRRGLLTFSLDITFSQFAQMTKKS